MEDFLTEIPDTPIEGERVTLRLLQKKTVYENVAFALETVHKSKRKIKNRILMSSYGEALGPAAQVAAQTQLKNGRWRFIQGGSDRLYPSEKTLPWIQEFCQNVGTQCDLKFDPQGEHDWSYWQKNHKEWILEFFSK